MRKLTEQDIAMRAIRLAESKFCAKCRRSEGMDGYVYCKLCRGKQREYETCYRLNDTSEARTGGSGDSTDGACAAMKLPTNFKYIVVAEAGPQSLNPGRSFLVELTSKQDWTWTTDIRKASVLTAEKAEEYMRQWLETIAQSYYLSIIRMPVDINILPAHYDSGNRYRNRSGRPAKEPPIHKSLESQGDPPKLRAIEL